MGAKFNQAQRLGQHRQLAHMSWNCPLPLARIHPVISCIHLEQYVEEEV